MHVLVVYVPVSHAETLKAALFEAGAGRLGLYRDCSWETSGTGQFRPLAGSRPFLGTEDALEKVEELRIEMLCPDECMDAVIASLRRAHPYEEPAFHAFPVRIS